MVDQEEFHHTFACSLCQRGIGEDSHAFQYWHRTTSDGLENVFHRDSLGEIFPFYLWCFLDFDQTHTAIPGNRQTFMVTVSRDFHATSSTSLNHSNGQRFNADRDTGVFT